MLVAEALARRGIHLDEGELDTMIAEKIEQAPSRDLFPAPMQELTSAEIAALQRGDFDLTPLDHGKRDPYAETVAEYAALIAKSFTEGQAATWLGVDESRIRQRRSQRTLYAVRAGGWRIPDFQFDGDTLLPGISQVIPALPATLHPVAVERWFAIPNPDLTLDEKQLSPRDWLRTGGDVGIVVALAKSL